ncbi:MAG TPA: acyltransferase [Noviherbaspirillum sp.]|nr:acyltransferase [Noviherbaspirillum sp.]
MSQERLDYLDGWRGMAICFLLIGHFFPVPGVNFGAIGVGLFFVLSGLFMGRLLFVTEVPLGTFFRRRVARIIPATFAFILATVILRIVLGRPIDWAETLVAALFINNYFPSSGAMPLGHIWSLSVEEHSYILLAFLALAARKRVVRAAASTALVSVACILAAAGYFFLVAHDATPWLRTEVAGYGIFLSAFLAIALHGKSLPQLPWLAYPALLAIGIAVHWWSVPMPVRITVGISLFGLTLHLLAAAPTTVKAVLSFGPLRQIGVLSFSIYLWQQPYYLLVHKEGMNPLLALALALLSGIASFYVVEKPAREYLNRRWRGKDRPDLLQSTLRVETR